VRMRSSERSSRAASVEVVIPSGANAEGIGEILRDAGLIRSVSQFETAVRAAGADTRLQSGTYTFITGTSLSELIDELEAGPRIVVFDVTIREGLRVTEIIDVLADASGLDRALFVEALESGLVQTSVATLPANPTLADWEGLLFPDTYRFSEEATPAGMLRRLASTMEQRMDSVDWSAFEAAGFTRYQGIIIASLIESEVRVSDERPIVSSVIRNRITDGARLDIDATVLYAMGIRDPAKLMSRLILPTTRDRFRVYRLVRSPHPDWLRSRLPPHRPTPSSGTTCWPTRTDPTCLQ
jgi:UPF0755 protein